MTRDAMQSLARLIIVAAALVALLAGVTVARFALTRPSRDAHTMRTSPKAMKGDVRRSEDGKLQYFDGHQWTSTPPPPNDDAF